MKPPLAPSPDQAVMSGVARAAAEQLASAGPLVRLGGVEVGRAGRGSVTGDRSCCGVLMGQWSGEGDAGAGDLCAGRVGKGEGRGDGDCCAESIGGDDGRGFMVCATADGDGLTGPEAHETGQVDGGCAGACGCADGGCACCADGMG